MYAVCIEMKCFLNLLRSAGCSNPGSVLTPVWSYDFDKRADFLENKFKNNDSVEIINADVLNVEWPEKVKIVANLPYSISTPIIEKIMHNNVREAYIMLQREVALRCLAEPGSENYSRLSLLCKTHAKISRLMDISPESFVPKPKVNSTRINAPE